MMGSSRFGLILTFAFSFRVVYFSIHRFEYGTFWPNLHQSDFDYIGSGRGEGFNFNLPLNKKGMTNGDYMAIFQQILLPVAVEVNFVFVLNFYCLLAYVISSISLLVPARVDYHISRL